MKVVAECNGYLMITEDDVDTENGKIDIDTRVRVYNPDLNVLAPETSAGSWVVRMGPWRAPIKSYNVDEILDAILTNAKK